MISKSFFCSVLLVAGGLLARADLPLARLSAIYPAGGQAGRVVEVTVSGSDLDDTGQMLFSDRRIEAKVVASTNTHSSQAASFTVSIPAEVPPGIYDARVVGRFGASNPRAYAVGDLPESLQNPTNTAAADATELFLGSVVNGRAVAGAMSHFKFAARRGQHILVECQSREIDSRLEPNLFLFDDRGKELERSRQGGLLDFVAPKDGQYALELHDALFRGGAEYFYRLTVSTRPHIDFIFPSSGVPGTRGKFVLYGRNLPGGTAAAERANDGKPLEHLEIKLEMPRAPEAPLRAITGQPLPLASAVLDAVEYRLKSTNGCSNPVLIDFASAPLIIEKEPNDTPPAAESLAVPLEYNGRFYPLADRDWIRFEAKKGDLYWIEVFSQRLGLPADPFVLIQRATHNERGDVKVSDLREIYSADASEGGVEFNTATRDPAWRFEVKESGQYRLEVRDLFNSGHSDPRRVYRLAVRPETPDFRLLAVPQSPPPPDKDRKEAHVWSTYLRRGQTLPVRVLALRRDGFDGEIQLSADGLPAGVAFSPGSIEPGQGSGFLLLTAAENASAWAGPITIVGKAKVAGAEAVRSARAATVLWDVADSSTEAVQSRLTTGYFLGVSGEESAPMRIDLAGSKELEVPVDGKLQIPLKLVSRVELTGNLKIRLAGLAFLENSKELEISGKTNLVTVEFDVAQAKVPLGTHRVYAVAQAQTRYLRSAADKPEDRTVMVCSGPLTVRVNPKPLTTAATHLPSTP